MKFTTMNLTMLGMMLLAATAAMGCAKPSAAAVCHQLEAGGVAVPRSCRSNVPAALNARAQEEYVFDLLLPKGKTGHVLAFGTTSGYDATVQAYESMAILAGSHRYGSPSARIFVQLSSEASLGEGKKTKDIVDAL